MVGFEQELLAVFFVGHSCDLAFLGRRSLGFSKCPGTRGLLLFMDLGARAKAGVHFFSPAHEYFSPTIQSIQYHTAHALPSHALPSHALPSSRSISACWISARGRRHEGFAGTREATHASWAS